MNIGTGHKDQKYDLNTSAMEIVGIGLTLWNILLVFLILRVLQRVYYFFKGHTHFGLDFDPRKRLESFFTDNGILFTEHSFVSKHDDVMIRYRRIGNGKKTVLLSNGVGTDLFMWLPVLKNMHTLNPNIFTGDNGMTLLAPCFRGLFGSHKVNRNENSKDGSKTTMKNKKISMKTSDSFNEDNNVSLRDKKYDDEIEVTISTLAHDLVDVFHHFEDQHQKNKSKEEGAKDMSPASSPHKDRARRESHLNTWTDTGYDQYDMVMGWSLGAMTILKSLQFYPSLASKMILMNPTTGRSLHTALQAFFPLPLFISTYWSAIIIWGIKNLRPLCRTHVWVILKNFADSIVFRMILEMSSFLGGFPPEQAAYFSVYMQDVFSDRRQTRGLLDLIVALDSPLTHSTCCGYGSPLKTTTMADTHGKQRQQTEKFASGIESKLIISGIPDIMSGIYHSTRLCNNMDQAVHKTFTMGSHFILLEWPEVMAEYINDFFNS